MDALSPKIDGLIKYSNEYLDSSDSVVIDFPTKHPIQYLVHFQKDIAACDLFVKNKRSFYVKNYLDIITGIYSVTGFKSLTICIELAIPPQTDEEYKHPKIAETRTFTYSDIPPGWYDLPTLPMLTGMLRVKVIPEFNHTFQSNEIMLRGIFLSDRPHIKRELLQILGEGYQDQNVPLDLI